MTLQLYPTHDNGGTVVTDYLLYRNQGDGDSTTVTMITADSYSYATNGFLVSITDLSLESMTAGLFYQFSFKAVNKVDESDLSHILTVSVADYPEAPTGLSRVKSSESTISLAWDETSDTQLPAGLITGYHLWMDNGLHGNFELVYNGEGVPTVLQYMATDLVTGRPYRFYVTAWNHVGESPTSDLALIYACAEPSGLAAPIKIDISKTSVTIQWTEPTNNGGCPITSYSLLRDGGPADETFTEVHAAAVNGNPTLSEFTITDLPADIVGSDLRIRMHATNLASLTTTSEEVLVVIVADKPSAPTNGPMSVYSVTAPDRIAIEYSEPDTGGSPITNFEVQMDDGIGGGFETIAGGDMTLYQRTSATVRNH